MVRWFSQIIMEKGGLLWVVIIWGLCEMGGEDWGED